MVEALKAMFLVENGSSRLGKRTKSSKIRPIRAAILMSRFYVLRRPLRQGIFERLNGAVDPITLLIIKNYERIMTITAWGTSNPFAAARLANPLVLSRRLSNLGGNSEGKRRGRSEVEELVNSSDHDLKIAAGASIAGNNIEFDIRPLRHEWWRRTKKLCSKLLLPEGSQCCKTYNRRRNFLKLDIKQLSSTHPKPFRIADFGCSTGHNSFPWLQIITEAVAKKIKTEGLISQIPDFQGPPLILLIHLVLNWLSEVPKAVADCTPPAWSKGKAHYTGSKKEVIEAYSNHYAKHIKSFLEARAQEVVSGGLMALLVPGVPNFENSGTSYTTPVEIDLLGSCLMDMAKKSYEQKEDF
ncbi:hypothetical protein BUALT_Bualt05G0119100 [Buddleja alternifolia]|uniref:Uncharacterized protein n=1 Tax=Buddleja alternifolia TaxID=168488 RepID=A0AAV6XIN9_9LAMI|nr:hypothetical protein BUALT_Bualt05G0119100 [Buddleja alternifolia]